MAVKKIKTLGPRVTDNNASFYDEVFGSKTAGAEFVLAAFPGLYRGAVHRLKVAFSADELKMIIDSYNGTMLSPDFAGRAVSEHLKDAMELEGLAEKWSVDKERVMGVSSTLDRFDSSCLEIWAQAFWEGDHDDLDAYVAQ